MRPRLITSAPLAALLAFAQPCAGHAQFELPWHLGPRDDACATCLDIAPVWTTFGFGDPTVEVAVVESARDVNLAEVAEHHPYLPRGGIDAISVSLFDHYETTRFDADMLEVLAAHAGQSGSEIGPQPRDLFEDKEFKRAVAEANRPSIYGRLGRSQDGHALHMLGLIKSWPRGGPLTWPLSVSNAALPVEAGPAPLGVAPAVTVRVAFWRADSPDDLLAYALGRSRLRVMNLSYAGVNPIGRREFLDDLELHALLMSGLGPRTGNGRERVGILLVAAAGNVTVRSRFADAVVETQKVAEERAFTLRASDSGSPFVDGHFAPKHGRFRELNPKPDVPLLVVGGVGPNGAVVEYGTRDDRIDLFAPTGDCDVSRLSRQRDPPENDPRYFQCALASKEFSKLDARPACASDLVDKATLTRETGATIARLGVVTAGWPSHCGSSVLPKSVRVATGTSAATALVSGVAALMFSVDPTLSAREARDILRATARRRIVNGLPILDPAAALETVVERMVRRWALDTLARTQHGRAPRALERLESLVVQHYFDDGGAILSTEAMAVLHDGAARRGLRMCARWSRAFAHDGRRHWTRVGESVQSAPASTEVPRCDTPVRSG